MFDMDGTLVDTMAAFAELACDVMERFHGAERRAARARYLETSGAPFVRQLETIHPGHGANAAAASAFEAQKRAICERAAMSERTVRALEGLRSHGMRLIVSSNAGQPFVDAFARRAGVPFELVFGFDPARGLEKGRPHVERALAHFGLAAEHLWFVGDSLHDGHLARECGVQFVGRVGTFSQRAFAERFPDAPSIHEIDELEGLVSMGG